MKRYWILFDTVTIYDVVQGDYADLESATGAMVRLKQRPNVRNVRIIQREAKCQNKKILGIFGKNWIS